MVSAAKTSAGRASARSESPAAAHHRQLPVGGQAAVDEQHHDETGDGQDHRDEAGHQQEGEVDEHEGRKAVIHDELDEAQRLGEPDQRHQPRRDRDKADPKLAEYVAVEPVHGE